MTTPATTPTAAPLTPAASSVRGRFVWYDLMTPDVEAAARFYGAVTGWTTVPWTGGETPSPYTMWANGGTPMGGVMTQPPEETARGERAHWLAYIGTPDLDATYRDAVALGARTYVAPATIPDVGRFAVLADPQGAAFAAFQPATPGAPPQGMPPAGTFSWHELVTTDHAAALAFYAALFGWAPTEAMDMGADGIYQMYGHGAATYGGIYNRRHAEVPPHWLLYVRVPDLDRALDAVRQGGGEVLNGPMEVPGGDHVAQCRDPHGAHFALHATRAQD